MDTNTSNTLPNMEPENKKGSSLAIVLVIAIIIAGGVYFFMQREKVEAPTVIQEEASIQSGNDTYSDELNDISEDLDATNFDELNTNIQ
ncbi:hypothetical protein IPF86_01090 [Candidatus Nomurabacteria bacterium]|jgi:hypothetical protein|nr:MAG: hypothetical protein IPF86_01090 [Candidatus Nomurabacteria bacterium]